MKTHMFGFYNYVLGFCTLAMNRQSYEVFDRMVAEKQPERQVGNLFKSAWALTDLAPMIARAGGFQNEKHYIWESDVTPRMHLITKPFFFLSSRDDPFFGPDCIPIDHCYDQILIGVTKYGSHCAYFEGKYRPTGQWFTKPTMEFLQHFKNKAARISEEPKRASSELILN